MQDVYYTTLKAWKFIKLLIKKTKQRIRECKMHISEIDLVLVM